VSEVPLQHKLDHAKARVSHYFVFVFPSLFSPPPSPRSVPPSPPTFCICSRSHCAGTRFLASGRERETKLCATRVPPGHPSEASRLPMPITSSTSTRFVPRNAPRHDLHPPDLPLFVPAVLSAPPSRPRTHLPMLSPSLPCHLTPPYTPAPLRPGRGARPRAA
jgi:hypothetical protein